MNDRYRTIAENFLANPRPVVVLAEEFEVSASTIYRALKAHDISPSEHQERIDIFVAMSLAARAAFIVQNVPHRRNRQKAWQTRGGRKGCDLFRHTARADFYISEDR